MKYVQPVGALTDAPYVDANPVGGIEGSAVPAAAIEHPMRELVALIVDAGLVPDDTVLTQIATAVRMLIQKQAPVVASATGAADAITAAFTPAITALTNGMTLRFRATNPNATTTPTFTPASGSIAAKAIVKGAGSPLVPGDIAGAGAWIALQYDLALDKWVLLNPATGVSPLSGLAGSVRNAKMSVTAASSSATFTADEILVGSALGGGVYKVANVNKTINLATTGSGGMDTGTAPVSGYVGLYLFYNPSTGASEVKAVNATSSVLPMIYAGANASNGFTASALISVWPTNASSQFATGLQTDRYVGIAPIQNVLTTSTVQASATSLSIASAVPKNALTVSGHLNINSSATSTQTLYIGSDSNMSGATFVADTGLGVGAPFSGIQLAAPQTVFYKSSNSAGTPNFYIYISGYTF